MTNTLASKVKNHLTKELEKCSKHFKNLEKYGQSEITIYFNKETSSKRVIIEFKPRLDVDYCEDYNSSNGYYYSILDSESNLIEYWIDDKNQKLEQLINILTEANIKKEIDNKIIEIINYRAKEKAEKESFENKISYLIGESE